VAWNRALDEKTTLDRGETKPPKRATASSNAVRTGPPREDAETARIRVPV
jgi:hypothetical protein